MSFFDKALGTGARPQPRTITGYRPAAPAQPAPQQPQSYAQQQGLAIGSYEQSHLNQAGQIAAQQGFIKKPPTWVQKQPTETCPECHGVNFSRHGQGEGTYGKRKQTTVGEVDYGRCFDCNFTLNGGRQMSDGQVGNAHTHGVMNTNAAVSATRQPHGLKNFYTIKAG